MTFIEATHGIMRSTRLVRATEFNSVPRNEVKSIFSRCDLSAVFDAAQLERRVMFSAVPLAELDAFHDAFDAPPDLMGLADAATSSIVEVNELLGDVVDLAQLPHDLSHFDFDAAQELIFIDGAIDDQETLFEDVLGQQQFDHEVQVVVIDTARDGIEQISEILAARSDIDAIHLVSHGSLGRVKLGDAWLSIDSLDAYASDIAGWNDALSDDADILFYGCDLASNEAGRTIAETISTLCDCDVAASDDLTGHEGLGGDWELEFETGQIETNSVFSLETQRSWAQLLNVTVDASSAGTAADQNSLTVSHTTSGTDRLMLVAVASDPHGVSVDTVTYNGDNLTLVGAEADPSAHSSAEIWALVAPDTGTHDVVVDLNGTNHKGLSVGVLTFDGVDQTTPFYNFSTAFGNSTNATVALSSAVDDLVFGVVHSHAGSAATPSAAQTEHWDDTVDQTNSSGTTTPGAASITNSWTVNNDDWTVAAVSVKSSSNDFDPVFVGGSNTTVNSAETTLAVTTVTATDADTPAQTLTYSISGGADAAEFTIDGSTGALSFVAAPDFETPTDVGLDNVYDLTVQVSDGVGGFATQDIAVTVTDISTVAYEPFDYGAGTLQGNSGGIGWATGWSTVQGSSAVINPVGLVDPTSTLLTQGASAEMDTTSMFNQRRDIGIDLGADNTTMWLSFLLQVDSLSGGISVELSDGAGATNQVTIGTNSNDFLLTRDRSAATGSQIDNVLTDGQTYFVAARLEFEPGNDTVTMFIDPTPGQTAPDSPGSLTTQLTSADMGIFTKIGLVGGFSNNNSRIDEIRVGETFLAVAPSLANTSPTITSDGGGDTASTSVAENTANVTQVIAVDTDLPAQTLTYSIAGGADAAAFSIDGAGNLSFVAAPDFEAPSDAGGNNVYDVVVQVTDGSLTDTQNIAITVTPENDNTPAADADAFIVQEGGTATEADLLVGATLLDGDTDSDLPNDTLTVNTTPVSGPSFGALTLNANGTFSYTHDGSENLIDSFIYEVSDDVGNSDTATVTITVTAVNDNSPVADAESFTINIGGTATESNLDSGVSLLDGDTDADLPNDTLRVNTTPIVGANFGSLTLNANGTFSYTHDGSANLSDSFTYEVSDDLGNADTATVSITIANSNPPIADSESFSVVEGGTATQANLDVGASLLDGDTDLDLPGDTLSVDTTPVSGPSFGSLILQSNGNFTYTHDGSENFTDSFTYRVRDATNNGDLGIVSINITPVNDSPPVADAESFTVLEGGTATETSLDFGATLLDGDTDADFPNDSLTINTIPIVGPNFGSLTLNANGTFSYTHDGSENLSDSFTYELRDAVGNTDNAVVTINVTPVNDSSPSADDETFTVLEGGVANETALDFGTSLLDGDTDLDSPNDSLSVNTTPVTGPNFGTLTLNANGTFTYAHDGSENFADSFEYEVVDAIGNTATASVVITITPVNEGPPVADAESFTVVEGGTATETDLDVGASLLDGDTDSDFPNDTLTVSPTPITSPNFGLLTLNANGTFSYTHDGSENFADSFTYEVRDSVGSTDTAVVTISITPQNDRSPVADSESFVVVEGGTATEADLIAGVSLLDGDTDADLPNDTLIVSTTPVIGPNFGFLTLNSNGTFSYTHDGSENHTDGFTYEVQDAIGNASTATVSIAVTPSNDNSPIADDESFTVSEGGTATEADLIAGVSLLDGDTDLDLPNDTLTVNTTPVVDPNFGFLTLNSDGTFTYTHDGSENFSDGFVYEVVDASGNVDTASVSITITPVNDSPPNADDESFTVSVGGTATNADLDSGATLLDGDTDADLPGDFLSVNTTPVNAPNFGTLNLNTDGSFSYDHDGSLNLIDSFTYEVIDSTGNSAIATVTINVTQIPLVLPPSISNDEAREPNESTNESDSSSTDPPLENNGPTDVPTDATSNDPTNGPQRGSSNSSRTNLVSDRDFNLVEQETASPSLVPDAANFRSYFVARRSQSRDRPTVDSTVTLQTSWVPTPDYSLAFMNGFDDLRDDVDRDRLVTQAVLGSSLVATTSLSVGYVIWLIRGGVLLSSVLSSLPAWQMVDPLPVLGYLSDEDTDADSDDDSLEDLVRKSNKLDEVER